MKTNVESSEQQFILFNIVQIHRTTHVTPIWETTLERLSSGPLSLSSLLEQHTQPPTHPQENSSTLTFLLRKKKQNSPYSNHNTQSLSSLDFSLLSRNSLLYTISRTLHGLTLSLIPLGLHPPPSLSLLPSPHYSHHHLSMLPSQSSNLTTDSLPSLIRTKQAISSFPHFILLHTLSDLSLFSLNVRADYLPLSPQLCPSLSDTNSTLNFSISLSLSQTHSNSFSLLSVSLYLFSLRTLAPSPTPSLTLSLTTLHDPLTFFWTSHTQLNSYKAILSLRTPLTFFQTSHTHSSTLCN